MEERRHWQEWDFESDDGYSILDPDGFRGGKPEIVTKAEFERAKAECTLVSDADIWQWRTIPKET